MKRANSSLMPRGRTPSRTCGMARRCGSSQFWVYNHCRDLCVLPCVHTSLLADILPFTPALHCLSVHVIIRGQLPFPFPPILLQRRNHLGKSFQSPILVLSHIQDISDSPLLLRFMNLQKICYTNANKKNNHKDGKVGNE